jgi:hypothetical protein
MQDKDQQIPVIGFETVQIRTKRSPGQYGCKSHATMKLKNVLHIPSLVCNIIGMPDSFLEDYKVKVSMRSTRTSKGTIMDHDGRSIAYFSP